MTREAAAGCLHCSRFSSWAEEEAADSETEEASAEEHSAVVLSVEAVPEEGFEHNTKTE